MKKTGRYFSLGIIILAAMALSGCYTQLATSDNEDRPADSQEYTSADTGVGPTIINNYYGSDAYREWQYRTSFRYFSYSPHMMWDIGWSDPFYDAYWDPWYTPYAPYPWHNPYWSRPYYYSDWYTANPYYYPGGYYGIPVIAYGNSAAFVAPRRRTTGSLRGGDAGSIRGGTAAIPPPATGGVMRKDLNEATRIRAAAVPNAEVKTESPKRVRQTEETPWWVRMNQERRAAASVGTQGTDAAQVRRRASTTGTAVTPPQRRTAERPAATSSDAARERRQRPQTTPAPRQEPPRRVAPPERTQQREAVPEQRREAPRYTPPPSPPQQQSAPPAQSGGTRTRRSD
jgi:hypothetical protein